MQTKNSIKLASSKKRYLFQELWSDEYFINDIYIIEVL